MTPLEAAWEHYGGTLLGTHGRVKAKCPLHSDNNPSAAVNIEEQKWVCHAGCGYGDIYELVKLADSIDSFPECRDFADQKFGSSEKNSPRSKTRSRGRRKSWV